MHRERVNQRPYNILNDTPKVLTTTVLPELEGKWKSGKGCKSEVLRRVFLIFRRNGDLLLSFNRVVSRISLINSVVISRLYCGFQYPGDDGFLSNSVRLLPARPPPAIASLVCEGQENKTKYFSSTRHVT